MCPPCLDEVGEVAALFDCLDDADTKLLHGVHPLERGEQCTELGCDFEHLDKAWLKLGRYELPPRVGQVVDFGAHRRHEGSAGLRFAGVAQLRIR